MGESKNSYFRVRFNQKLKIGFKGTQVTSDGGLVAIREMDEHRNKMRISKVGNQSKIFIFDGQVEDVNL